MYSDWITYINLSSSLFDLFTTFSKLPVNPFSVFLTLDIIHLCSRICLFLWSFFFFSVESLFHLLWLFCLYVLNVIIMWKLLSANSNIWFIFRSTSVDCYFTWYESHLCFFLCTSSNLLLILYINCYGRFVVKTLDSVLSIWPFLIIILGGGEIIG